MIVIMHADIYTTITSLQINQQVHEHRYPSKKYLGPIMHMYDYVLLFSLLLFIKWDRRLKANAMPVAVFTVFLYLHN